MSLLLSQHGKVCNVRLIVCCVSVLVTSSRTVYSLCLYVNTMSQVLSEWYRLQGGWVKEGRKKKKEGKKRRMGFGSVLKRREPVQEMRVWIETYYRTENYSGSILSIIVSFFFNNSDIFLKVWRGDVIHLRREWRFITRFTPDCSIVELIRHGLEPYIRDS